MLPSIQFITSMASLILWTPAVLRVCKTQIDTDSNRKRGELELVKLIYIFRLVIDGVSIFSSILQFQLFPVYLYGYHCIEEYYYFLWFIRDVFIVDFILTFVSFLFWCEAAGNNLMTYHSLLSTLCCVVYLSQSFC